MLVRSQPSGLVTAATGYALSSPCHDDTALQLFSCSCCCCCYYYCCCCCCYCCNNCFCNSQKPCNSISTFSITPQTKWLSGWDNLVRWGSLAWGKTAPTHQQALQPWISICWQDRHRFCILPTNRLPHPLVTRCKRPLSSL